jgi:predicted kinase
MLRASAKTPNGPVILCGLSDGNIGRLRAGQPIRAELRSFGVDLPGLLTIIHGPTEADIERTLRGHGLITDRTLASASPKLDQEAEARARHERVLIATVGLPRSGKSTWAREQTYPVVNPDAIRLALHGQRFYAPAEPLVWATAKIMVRALFGAGHRVVVLDATNASRARRDDWRSKEWGLFFKHIDTPAEVCLQRAVAEKDDEIIDVIHRMGREFVPLGDDEPRWP